MSDFFTEKVTKIRTSLAGLETNCMLDDPDDDLSTASLPMFEPATEEEVGKLISAASNATCSLDPFPTVFVKRHRDTLVPCITKMVNESLSSGTFPDTYKQAIVKPLLKKQGLDKDCLKN